MTTIETKEARLNELKAELAEIDAEIAVEETAIVEAEIVEVKTASEMKAAYAASRNVVRVHFTAKGNPAWQSIYHYGLHDRETGYQRISKKDAAAELAKFGLTTEQVIAVQKAQDAINAEESEAYKTARNEGRCYSRLCYHKVYQKALAMVFGEDEPATVEETAESLPESPASVVKPLNFTAKIIYDNGCTDARFASYDEAYSWIKDQENVFPRFNSTITFFNRETLDTEILYQNSNDDTEPEPPDNDDELIDASESAPVNIETTIAKNRTLICKLNGKRASWANTLDAFEANAIGTVITGNGHSYTCINDNEPAPEGLAYETGYLFEDENGNRYIFDNSAFAIRAIAYNNVDEYAVTQDATVEAEPANVETANVEVKAELPSGNVTVNSGAEAWAVVGKHFPKGNLEFYRAYKGFNNEDKFCYTLDEIIYVHVTCTPDNSRVKCIEIVNTYEESESERNILTVNIAPPVKAEETAIENEPVIVETANEEPDGYNPDVFSLLPKLEDLNDVDGEFDEDAAEYTDRDDRYNRGEKIAEGLTAKLRAFDPTVEVTFAIDDDEDTYYLSYDGIIRTPFTATGVEASFHAMKQGEAKPEAPTDPELKAVDVKKVSAVVYYTCADDKSNWAKDKYFETTTAAAEWILSFVKTRVFDCTVRDAEIIDRRNGYVRYALTDADVTAVNAVNTEPELPSPKPNSPYAIARGLDDVFQKTFHRVAAPYMDVTTQDGAKIVTTFGAAFVSVDWRATDGYVFGNHYDDVLARYETPAQVETVIGKLKDAVERHKPVFHFPTVEELNASPEPPKTESVKARKSSLSPSARRYINAREEAQERRIRREYLWDLEQRFYPN